MAINKEVFVKKTTSGNITAGSYAFFDFQEEATKSDYLPFNKLRILNKSSVEIWVYLEGVTNALQPDYILGAGTGMDEDVLQGVNYNLIAIKNNDSSAGVNANEIIIRMATVRESA